MSNFTYLIAGEVGKRGAVIDPGWAGSEVDRIIDEALNSDIVISHVIITHCHSDHIGGLSDIIRKTGARVLLHEAEKDDAAGMGYAPDRLVKDGEVINLDGLDLKIIHTPGHSAGSICLYAKDKLFTGDTLFVGGCGRADLPGGNPETLYDSLKNKLMLLPDNTEIYPGHNYGVTITSTIGKEKKSNRYLKCRSFNEFFRIRMGYSCSE